MSHPFLPKQSIKPTSRITLRVKRILIPFSVVLLGIVFIDQVLIKNPFTADKQIETIIGILAAYGAIIMPNISFEI